MRGTSLLKDHPVLLLGLVVVGLVAWVALDATPRPAPPPDDAGTAAPGEVAQAGPDGPIAPPVRGRYPNEPGAVNALMVDLLFPGMTRREVEELLGAPAAGRVAAADPDRLTYRTTYPILRDPTPDGPPPALVALEFDASRPGHPLVRVHRAETF